MKIQPEILRKVDAHKREHDNARLIRIENKTNGNGGKNNTTKNGDNTGNPKIDNPKGGKDRKGKDKKGKGKDRKAKDRNRGKGYNNDWSGNHQHHDRYQPYQDHQNQFGQDYGGYHFQGQQMQFQQNTGFDWNQPQQPFGKLFSFPIYLINNLIFLFL